MIPACTSHMCSFNRGNTEGTNSSKFCVWCLRVSGKRRRFLQGLVLWTDLRKGDEKSLKCVFAYD